MDIAELTHALRQDAAWVVFINVLLQQLGLPIPAVPTLLIAGSLATSPVDALRIIGLAVLASVLADWFWYLAGRAFGYRVLSGLCRLSINPGDCVSQTESRFTRWGVWSLVIAKFIPGFSTVAPPIAGSLRMRLPSFLVAAGMGAALWAGLAMLGGWLMRTRIHEALIVLRGQEHRALLLLATLFGIWLGWKFWQKYRFERLAAIPHITPEELLIALASPTPPIILDLRGNTLIQELGPIPDSRQADYDTLADSVADLPKHQAIVTLCACPQDAGAIQAARALIDLGYHATRPLKGGWEAWRALQEPPAALA